MHADLQNWRKSMCLLPNEKFLILSLVVYATKIPPTVSEQWGGALRARFLTAHCSYHFPNHCRTVFEEVWCALSVCLSAVASAIVSFLYFSSTRIHMSSEQRIIDEQKKQAQLAGANAAMEIASKIQEGVPPATHDIVKVLESTETALDRQKLAPDVDEKGKMIIRDTENLLGATCVVHFTLPSACPKFLTAVLSCFVHQ
jgi:hypothetical protein